MSLRDAPTRVDEVATCRRCSPVTQPLDLPPTCPACGSADVRVRGGDSPVLESIAVLATIEPGST